MTDRSLAKELPSFMFDLKNPTNPQESPFEETNDMQCVSGDFKKGDQNLTNFELEKEYQKTLSHFRRRPNEQNPINVSINQTNIFKSSSSNKVLSSKPDLRPAREKKNSSRTNMSVIEDMRGSLNNFRMRLGRNSQTDQNFYLRSKNLKENRGARPWNKFEKIKEPNSLLQKNKWANLLEILPRPP